MVEGLPSAREDEPEVSGRRCSDHVAVRNPSRSEDEEPLPGVEPIVAHRHLTASLQHVERLVLALVDMRRGAGPSAQQPITHCSPGRITSSFRNEPASRKPIRPCRYASTRHGRLPRRSRGRSLAGLRTGIRSCSPFTLDTYRYLFPSEMEVLGDRLETVRDAAKARRARTRYGPSDNDLSGTAGGMTRLRGGG